MSVYIKIEGKDKKKAIEELEMLAMNTPKVCIKNTMIDDYMPTGAEDLEFNPNTITEYFSKFPLQLNVERCANIVSKKDYDFQKYDFVFEWLAKPEKGQVNELKKDIREKLDKLNIKYEITED
jgi:hypothetical protein